MPFLIPTLFDGKTAFYRQNTTLDGKDFLLNFRFSTRENAWYLSISSEPDTFALNGKPDVLAQGIKIVPRAKLLRQFASHRMPPGELVALVNGTDDSPPGLRDLGEGRQVELFYVTAAELKAGFGA